MAEKNLFTKDCRTGEAIYDKASAVCIMKPEEEVEVKSFTTPKGKQVVKIVRFRKTLGWILKSNLKRKDISRKDYLQSLIDNKKEPYEELDWGQYLDHLNKLDKTTDVIRKYLRKRKVLKDEIPDVQDYLDYRKSLKN